MSSDTPPSDSAIVIAAFNSLPRRIFLDSCTVQALGKYGSFLSDEGPLAESDPMYQVADGVANLEALREIMLVNERAQFEWIVSTNSAAEARAKNDKQHWQWFGELAIFAESLLQGDAETAASVSMANRLAEPRFNYLSAPDRLLIADALAVQCDGFLTMERRLPRNAPHLKRELGIQILTPITHWAMLRPWAALWR